MLKPLAQTSSFANTLFSGSASVSSTYCTCHWRKLRMKEALQRGAALVALALVLLVLPGRAGHHEECVRRGNVRRETPVSRA
jgi:hypothetical protein